MDDRKPLSDEQLAALLRGIDIPPPDEAAKLHTLNMAESRFAENLQKNAESRQGNADRPRLMDVLHHAAHILTGGQNMKKSYAILGSLAIGAAAVSLVAYHQRPFAPAQMQESVTTGSLNIAKPEIAKPETAVADAVAPAAPVAAMRAPVPQAQSHMSRGVEGIASSAFTPPPHPQPAYENRDQFAPITANPVKLATEEPVSTFSIDVDTASYAVVRRALGAGHLPPTDAIRVEEMINYFDYDYPLPESREEPFKPTVALYETPWNPDTVLMHIGIKGHELPADAPKPRSNLVFLLDVSGSMNSPDKLPLLKQAFRLLVDSLNPDDTIAIVTYAGNAGVVLEPTPASAKQKILHAIDTLAAGGSTAGAEGIRTAYELAESAKQEGGNNRVILATDGDFNVGITDPAQLKDFVQRKRDSGVYLSVLGFGQGNYNDALMQVLAQNGNGNAAYIDTLNEARKVLVDEVASTLYPIANDVKIQVEFNPAKVAEYRLIGYETRLLGREDFNNDKVDAGDIGAGHTVTAIYEVTPAGSKAQLVDALRYRQAETPEAGEDSEFAFLKLRYKLPGQSESRLITRPVTDADMQPAEALSDDIRFAGAVAAFGQLLRGDSHIRDYSYDDVLALATPARGMDAYNYRGEFLTLVRNAKAAQTQRPLATPSGAEYR